MSDINPFVVFEVKLEKDRGIVVLTIRKEEQDKVNFFRFHHQPLTCHPEQVQQSIRSHKVSARTKSIRVNIYGFLAHYWNEENKWFEFKGVKLNSTAQQLKKVQDARINKEIGLLKRKEAAGTKSRKQVELEALKEKNKEMEAKFQVERARRIAEAKVDIKKKNSETIED